LLIIRQSSIRLRLLWRQLEPDQRAKLRPTSLRAAADVPWEKQTFAQRRASYGAARPDDADFKTRSSELGRLERRELAAASTLIMQELPKPRESTIFIKGDFTRPGERVTPATPAILPKLEVENPNRLDLARWLFEPENPLPARVMANRVWQQYFGRGLVETENDFGTQGSRPTHPELLDWLASEFVESGWNVKVMMKRLVMTEAFRRSAERNRVSRCGLNSPAWIRDSLPSLHRGRAATSSREPRDRHPSRASDHTRRA